MNTHLPYIPGRAPRTEQPMGRYLPPLPEGVAATWLENRIPRGGWVLDPFGAAPRLIEEIARGGYRVLVAANNPVIAFLLKMTASPPRPADLKSALASIGSAKLRDARLEPYLRSLYQTRCQSCQADIQAEAFLWDHEELVPYGRIYTCPHCNDSGEYPTTEADKSMAAQFGDGGLPRARALERVAPLDDPDRLYAKEALDVYPDRAVYVLSALINKLDGGALSVEQRDHWSALLLTAFDRANTLWPHPTARERPRQLTIPPKYRENNIWLALEEAVALWASDAPSLPLTIWPKHPPDEGGICLFEGRIKDLVKHLGEMPIGAVLTALPRPNQAFWTLSALWAGWLWRSEAIEEFKSVLRRQRYSWRWHNVALHIALEHLNAALRPKTPIFGLIGETEPGYLTAVVTAAHFAGLELQGVAMQAKQGQTQISLVSGDARKKVGGARNIKEIIKAGANSYLEQRGEPAVYLPVLAAGLGAYAHEISPSGSPAESFYDFQKTIEEAISYRGGFLRLEAAGQSPESGYWWLEKYAGKTTPLADRVEIEVVNYLLEHPGCTLDALDAAMCAAFPGLFTPEVELIGVCLDSYGEEGVPGSGFWRLREGDRPANRLEDLIRMGELIQALGRKLGFVTRKAGDDPLIYHWLDEQKTPQFSLYLTASAVLGKIIQPESRPKGKALIVLPGGRANLVACKLRNNPLLREEIEKNWIFIKYRRLRYLNDNPMLTLDNFDEQLGLDPLTYAEPQIRLL